jgi:siroheme synthase-like protein
MRLGVMQADYPIFLDVAERLIVVVGGGSAAVRKVRGLVDAGAQRIRVVAMEIDPKLPLTIERISEPYRSAHLDGALLVFAATKDAGVNVAVARDAHRLGILVNRADAEAHWQEGGDFITSAALRRGPVRIGVVAGAPSMAIRLRDRIGEWIDPQWVALAVAGAALRPVILSKSLTPQQREAVFADMLSPEAMAIAGEEAAAGVIQWLVQRHPELGLDAPRRPEKEEL